MRFPVVATLAISLSVACATSPDQSLTVPEYAALGMPDPAGPWNPAEIRQARGVLQAIHARDPAQLPRYGSRRSGPVFDRLLAASGDLDGLFEDRTVGELLELNAGDADWIAERSLMGVYMREDSLPRFSREAVEIMGVSARALGERCVAWIAVGEKLGDAERSTGSEVVREMLARHAGTAKPLEATALSVFVYMVAVLAQDATSAEAATAGLEHLARAHGRCAPVLSPVGAARARDLMCAGRARKLACPEGLRQ